MFGFSFFYPALFMSRQFIGNSIRTVRLSVRLSKQMGQRKCTWLCCVYDVHDVIAGEWVRNVYYVKVVCLDSFRALLGNVFDLVIVCVKHVRPLKIIIHQIPKQSICRPVGRPVARHLLYRICETKSIFTDLRYSLNNGEACNRVNAYSHAYTTYWRFQLRYE